jgi:glutamine amidotransferase
VSVAVVGYGLGNTGSVLNMFKRIGADAYLATTPEEVAAADRVLLPGIGAFDAGVAKLIEPGFADAIRDVAAAGRPVLGICLGMQLLLDGSEEGTASGLGLIPGRSRRFAEAAGIRVPHMGWSAIEPRRTDPLIAGAESGSRFYFVHSYHVVPDRPDDGLTTSDYGIDFVSMVRSGNVMGAQFHPEKSHRFGMTILRNFASL